MYSKSVAVSNINPSFSIAELVHLACSYSAHITIRNDQNEYNAKSIMGMMSLNLQSGVLLLVGEGEDAPEAVDRLASYLETALL